jgi:preprotein translocase subunit SecE
MFNKILIFLKEVRLEIKKINWPTRKEVVKYSLIVIGVSLAVAFFLGGVDFLIQEILRRFILK